MDPAVRLRFLKFVVLALPMHLVIRALLTPHNHQFRGSTRATPDSPPNPVRPRLSGSAAQAAIPTFTIKNGTIRWFHEAINRGQVNNVVWNHGRPSDLPSEVARIGLSVTQFITHLTPMLTAILIEARLTQAQWTQRQAAAVAREARRRAERDPSPDGTVTSEESFSSRETTASGSPSASGSAS